MIFHSPLSMHRQRWALTQDDVASLVGKTRSSISRLETGKGNVSLSTALALEILFNTSASTLLPHAKRKASQSMLPNVAQFSIDLEAEEGARGDRKRKLLEGLGERLADDLIVV